MTLRRLFPNTEPCHTLVEAAARARSLYREWLREAPRAVMKYPLDIEVSEFKQRIRHEFEMNRSLKNLDIINTILIKSSMDLIELHNKWMQRTHVLNLFSNGPWKVLKDQQRNPVLTGDAILGPVTNPTPFLNHFIHPKSTCNFKY